MKRADHGNRSLPRWVLALITWLAIYPTITVALALFEPLGLVRLPLALRTLVLTLAVVPAMVFVLVPGLTRLLLAARSALSSQSCRFQRCVKEPGGPCRQPPAP